MASRLSRSVSRRTILAGAPAGILTGVTARMTRAQPAAADPVSFYLGQVLALATLQAQAVRRLRPLLVTTNTADSVWQAATSAEAGVIGAVASVLGAMEPRPELTASVDELRLASDAYLGAADAARSAASGDLAALDVAGVRLAEGADHILIWLDALTAETGNDWGDGLRTLTEGTDPVPVVADIPVETPAEPVPEEPVAEEPVPEEPADEEPAEDEQTNRQARNRQNRQDQRAAEEPVEEQPDEEGRQNRQNRQKRPNQEERAAAAE